MTTDTAGIFDEDVLKALRSAIDCADTLPADQHSEYFRQLAHCHRTIADMLAKKHVLGRKKSRSWGYRRS